MEVGELAPTSFVCEEHMTKITVEHEGRSMDVIIPETGDKEYDNALIEWQKEKTLNDLKKRPKKPPMKVSKEDRQGAMKEYNEFRNRQKRGDIKKYY